jgi:hypothetical protein
VPDPSVSRDAVRRRIDSSHVALAADHPHIQLRQRVSRDPLAPAKPRVVAMILVYRHQVPIGIDHGRVLRQSLPDHPVIPIAVPDDHCGHARVHAFSEEKKIDPAFVLPVTVGQRQFSEFA